MIKKYFRTSFVITIIGLIISSYIGWIYEKSVGAMAEYLMITFVLALLEVSLSFDNAIVNAVVLREMTDIWRHRFLTWGMVIAVFGMRLVFPLLIVTVVSHVGPWAALQMATFAPHDYAQIMLKAHMQVSAFGGAFLLMVALKYFYDENKDEHWIPWLEKFLSALGKIEAIHIALTLLILILISRRLEEAKSLSFLMSGLSGVVTFVIVDGISSWLESLGVSSGNIHRASAGMFIYLEVLDASFSFDGVVGAFAITHNLFVIMIGLSIGAFFVRSLTIMFVEQHTLAKFLYLEHGAFYAIGALAGIMLASPFIHVPEWFTGLIGAVIILSSLIWSVRVNPKGLSGPKKQESR
jgi:hypothetical protein